MKLMAGGGRPQLIAGVGRTRSIGLYKTYEVVGYRELVEIYLESRRTQVHEVLTEHIKATVRSFEAALGVHIPESSEDVGSEHLVLWRLFSSSVDSALALRSPTSTFLMGGLIYTKLDAAGAEGRLVRDRLESISANVKETESLHLELLADLLAVLTERARHTCTIAEVRATGLYPGSTPPDFDMFDYM